MSNLNFSVKGTPYCRHKRFGDISAAKKWTDDIIEQTKSLPIVEYPCHLKVIFHLPPNKFPKDLPYGPDIDNLLKRTLDALGCTIFNNAIGKDSCVIRIEARKVKSTSETAGGRFEIREIKL